MGFFSDDLDPKKYFNEVTAASYKFAQEENLEKFKLFVQEKKINLNLPGKQDLTLLGLAVIRADKRAISNLIKAGADADQVIPNAGTPAVMAVTKHFNPPKTRALEGLIDGGYDLNRISSQGKPFIFYLVDYDHWPGLWLALKHGGNINIQSSGGESLLAYVLELPGVHGNNIARKLIDKGADVTLKGKRGESALLAIESRLRTESTKTPAWKEALSMRKIVLSKLKNPKDRITVFTDLIEKKIKDNP